MRKPTQPEIDLLIALRDEGKRAAFRSYLEGGVTLADLFDDLRAVENRLEEFVEAAK